MPELDDNDKWEIVKVKNEQTLGYQYFLMK
jgi:hypothetical protein